MSDIEHPAHKDEQIKLLPTTLLFSVSTAVAFVGMFLIMIYNHFGGF